MFFDWCIHFQGFVHVNHRLLMKYSLQVGKEWLFTVLKISQDKTVLRLWTYNCPTLYNTAVIISLCPHSIFLEIHSHCLLKLPRPVLFTRADLLSMCLSFCAWIQPWPFCSVARFTVFALLWFCGMAASEILPSSPSWLSQSYKLLSLPLFQLLLFTIPLNA